GQQVQGVHGGGTPEQRGPVPVPGSPRTREQRQRGAHGQQHGGNTHGPDARAVRQHDGDVLDGRPLTRDGGRARPVGAPEGDPAGAGGHAGQEQRVAAGRRQGRGRGRRGGSGLCGDGESSNLTSGGGRRGYTPNRALRSAVAVSCVTVAGPTSPRSLRTGPAGTRPPCSPGHWPRPRKKRTLGGALQGRLRVAVWNCGQRGPVFTTESGS